MSRFNHSSNSDTTHSSPLNREYAMTSSSETSSSDGMIPERQATFDGVLPNNASPKFWYACFSLHICADKNHVVNISQCVLSSLHNISCVFHCA